MSQLIHVIKPSGTRFEIRFSDDTSDEKILEALNANKTRFGYNGSVKKVDPNAPSGAPEIDWGDEASGFAYDHPNTLVVVLKTAVNTPGAEPTVILKDGKPVELRRIKGPPLSE